MKKPMIKRITALSLCLMLIIGTISIQGMAETIIPFNPDNGTVVIKPYYPNFDNSLGYNAPASGNGEMILQAMLNQIKDAEDPNSTNKPSSFYDDTLTPYGTKKNEPFTMLEKLELFEYTSLGDSFKNAKIFDDLSYKNSYGIQQNFVTATEQSISSGLSGLRFVRGIAFDPSGCGRRNYVALMGYRDTPNSTTTGSIYLYIINADNKKVEHQTTLFTNSEKLREFIKEVTVVDSSNFFQITAGDYNGNGCDSLVIGIGCINGSATIYQFGLVDVAYDTSAKKATVTNIYEGEDGKFLHSDFIKAKMGNSYNLANQLCISLATDDLNGDGIDDLVVLSCTGDITSDYVSKVQNKTCIPQLTVAYGQKGAKDIGKITAIDKISVANDEKNMTVACPGVAIGDVDGDDKREILVAGYKNNTKTNDVMVVPDDSSGGIRYAIYNTSGKGTLKRDGDIMDIAKSDVCPIAKDDSLRESETYFQQLAVECVALEGVNTQEYVFLSGWFYYMNSSKKLEPVAGNSKDTCPDTSFQNEFHYLATKFSGVDVDEVFVLTTSVGNFFATDDGREGIAVVVGYKSHTDANKEGKYNFRQSVYWGKDGTYGKNKITNFIGVDEASPMKHLGVNDYYGFVNGSCGNPGVAFFGVDVGKDTVVAKYSGKACTYTDPSPVAFLQAAPYYSELDAGNSSTQYSFSEGYRVTTGNSTETSYDIGLTVEAEAGPVKTSMDIGAAYEVIEEFAESLEKTYTTTFEANDQNQIILRQTLMYYYFYDVQVYDGTTGKYDFVPCALVVSAPQYPVLTSLSVEQYNTFAKAYNRMVDQYDNNGTKKVDKAHKMQVITDTLKTKYYLNNEGNPFAYASDSSKYKYNSNRNSGWDFGKTANGSTDNWMKLSYAGGTQQQAYTVTLDNEKTKSVAEGCYMNATIMAGGGIGPFSVYAGVSAGFERLQSSSYSTASITSTETSGAVQNLNSEQTSYRFNWKLIGWKADDLFPGVPFVGYAVKDQAAPPQPVNDLRASFSAEDGGKVTLTWTSPTVIAGRSRISHFYVNCDQSDSYVAATSNRGEGVEHTVVVDVSGYTERSATFTVSSYYETTNAASMPSNEVYVMFVLTDQDVNRLITQASNDLQSKIDALAAQIRSQNSITSDNLNNLITSYKAADALINSNVGDLQLVQDDLEKKMAAADVLLEEVIKKVEAELLIAIDELSQSNEEAITNLAAAYANADTLLNANISSLSGKHDALGKTVMEADKALQRAIDEVDEKLKAAIEKLSNADAETINQAIKELTEIYGSADEIIKADIKFIPDKMASLEQTMNKASEAIKSSIKKVQTDLESTKLVIDVLTKQLEEMEISNKEDIDNLNAELKNLKSQVSEKETINDALIKELAEVNDQQQSSMENNKVVSAIGFGVGSVSLTGNILFLILRLRKKFMMKL